MQETIKTSPRGYLWATWIKGSWCRTGLCPGSLRAGAEESVITAPCYQNLYKPRWKNTWLKGICGIFSGNFSCAFCIDNQSAAPEINRRLQGLNTFNELQRNSLGCDYSFCSLNLHRTWIWFLVICNVGGEDEYGYSLGFFHRFLPWAYVSSYF